MRKKIKNHNNLARVDGCIVNTSKEDYQKRLKSIKRNQEIEDLINKTNEIESIKSEIQSLKTDNHILHSKLDTIIDLLKS